MTRLDSGYHAISISVEEANQAIAALEQRADVFNTHLAHLVTERIRLFGRTEATPEEALILGQMAACVRLAERIRADLEWESNKAALDSLQLADYGIPMRELTDEEEAAEAATWD